MWETWEPVLKDGARELIREFTHLFSLDDMDLGKPSVVEHTIKVTDTVPLKKDIEFLLVNLRRSENI